MTLEEIENSLPNGLHDAEVQRIAIDYRNRALTLDLRVWIGNLDDAPERRELYRSGRIEVAQLLFLIMEPPDARYPFKNSIKLRIDGCDQRQNLNRELLNILPSNSFFRSLWIQEWNAFMHIAAVDARFTWSEEVDTSHE